MKQCRNCYFCDDELIIATTENGRDVTKARCDLLMKRWVDREGVCEFWNKRKDAEQ